jgi:FkbM family methyltransferase
VSPVSPTPPQLLADPLVVVDVGARWGFADIWAPLGDRCLCIGFEPDAAECERLETLLGEAGARHRFVPRALAAQTGTATLHLTRDRACSSIYPPSPTAVGRHVGLGIMEPDGAQIIETTTLDDWCAAEGVQRVDVLKIDTQGSELGVLQGAEATLGAVRAVEVEVQFNELYEGVPLFGDVDRFLRQRGFVLWKLRDLAHYAQAGAPTDGRTSEVVHYDTYRAGFGGGAGQLFWANAYYLHTSVAYPTAAMLPEQLVRDACITAALGFSDLVALALDLAGHGFDSA